MSTKNCHVKSLAAAVFALLLICSASVDDQLSFSDGTFAGWSVEGPSTWSLRSEAGEAKRFIATSIDNGETNVGVLRSEPFTITKSIQRFSIAGWDGTPSGQNDGKGNYVMLRLYPGGEILRQTHTPGGDKFFASNWFVPELVGKQAYVEVVDNNTRPRADGYAWISFADYVQDDLHPRKPVERDDLFAVKIDQNATPTLCRTLPFLVTDPGNRGTSSRKIDGDSESIPIDASAEAICLLGMINDGWDCGVAFWGENPELRRVRDDHAYIGCKVGEIEIKYADGKVDRFSVTLGATAWFIEGWTKFADPRKAGSMPEPFRSRPDMFAALKRSFKIQEDDDFASLSCALPAPPAVLIELILTKRSGFVSDFSDSYG